MNSDLVDLAQFGALLAALVVASVVTFGLRRYAAAFDNAVGRIEAGVSWIARSGWRAVLAVVVAGIVLRLALLPLLGVPIPFVHDEYSAILQAQMMVQGRFAWPTPALWEAFETFHVNMVPSYASIYFPGRGAPMALGLLLTGHPWPGVLIVMALLAGATVWALRGWMGPCLAFGGGLLVVVVYGIASYWVNSYWGGAFAALGGALLLGAWPRLLRDPRWRDGVLMGIGLLILMTTRPFEGLSLALPVAVACLVWLLRRISLGLFAETARLVVPAAGFLALGAAILVSTNLATTGEVGATAYGVNRETYATVPALLTAPPLEGPKRGDARFQAFYAWEKEHYVWRTNLRGQLRSVLKKTTAAWAFYVTPVLTIPFLFGLWTMVRQRRYVVLLLSGVAVMLAFFAVTWDFSHYVSPVFVVAVAAIMLGFGAMARAGPLLRRLAWTLPAAAVLALLVPLSVGLAGQGELRAAYQTPCCQFVVPTYRSELIHTLEALPGRHLLLVRYPPSDLLIHEELVWNEPDIDAARIIWARDLGPEMTADLMARYSDRTVWRVVADARDAEGVAVLTRLPGG